jgi:hypothetical protein
MVQREPELHGEDIHCANREQSQCGLATCEAIDDLINRSVAASSNDFLKAVLDSFPR